MRARPGQSCEHTCATYTHAHTQTRTHTYNVCLADIQTQSKAWPKLWVHATHKCSHTQTHTHTQCVPGRYSDAHTTHFACVSFTYLQACCRARPGQSCGCTQHTQMLTHTNPYAHTVCAWQIFRRTYNSPCLRVVHLPAGMLQSKAWPKLWVHATRVCWAGMHMKWMRGASTCSRGRIFLMVRQLLFPCH